MILEEFLAYNTLLFVLVYICLKAKDFGVVLIFTALALLSTFTLTEVAVTENVTIGRVRIANTTASVDGNNDTITAYVYDRPSDIEVEVDAQYALYFYIGLIVTLIINVYRHFEGLLKERKKKEGG